MTAQRDVPDLLEMARSLYRLRIPGDGAHLLNCYIWLGSDGVTLVDAGWADSAALIERALVVLGRGRRDVRRIVLTHFHEDHAGSAAEIAAWGPVEVVVGAGDAAFVMGRAEGPVAKLTAAEQRIHAETHRAPHGPPCRVDREVVDGDILDFAGGTRVVACPGHTPGSIALHLRQPNAVLTGDAVAEFNGAVILGVFNVDREKARASLEQIALTGAEIAGFGHGEVVIGGAYASIGEATDPLGG